MQIRPGLLLFKQGQRRLMANSMCVFVDEVHLLFNVPPVL